MGKQEADGCNRFWQSCSSMVHVTESKAGKADHELVQLNVP